MCYYLLYKDTSLNIILEVFKKKPNNKELKYIKNIYKERGFYGTFILEKI